jgi:hypothetical protein
MAKKNSGTNKKLSKSVSCFQEFACRHPHTIKLLINPMTLFCKTNQAFCNKAAQALKRSKKRSEFTRC